MLSVSRKQHPSRQRSQQRQQDKKRRRREKSYRSAKHLRRKAELSQKFRNIVIEDLGDEYVGIVEVARGGTYQRIWYLERKVCNAMIGKPREEEAVEEDDLQADGADEASKEVKSFRQPVLRGAALKRHNLRRQKNRARDVLGKINRKKVGRGRRIEITLTSLDDVPGAVEKIRKIVNDLAKRIGNNKIFAVWVRGYQQRGAEHYHLSLFVPGSQPLDLHDRSSISLYIRTRWNNFVRQTSAAQVAVRFPDDEEEADIADAYAAGQGEKSPKGSEEDADKGRKRKGFGIIRRSAYEEHVDVERHVLDDIDDAFKVRRLLRRALQARMRSWHRPRRHRPSRFAVEARFHLPEATAMEVLRFVLRERHGSSPPPVPLLP